MNKPQAVENIPINGRDYSSLEWLAPGAVNIGAGEQRDMRFVGTGTDDNEYTFDGIDATGVQEQNQKVGVRLAMPLGAIEEFRASTSVYAADKGGAPGGQFSVVSNSGTNQFHGLAFDFLRNSAFDARGPFDVTLPPFRINQFGVNVGGPIKKDRIFFFLDYEGIRQVLDTTVIGFVPTQAYRNEVAAASPVLAPLLSSWPEGTIPVDSQTNEWKAVLANTQREDVGFARVDHTFGPKTSVFARMVIDDATIREPMDSVGGYDEPFIRPSNYVAQLTHVFSPTIVNELRGGINRSAMHDWSYGTCPSSTSFNGESGTVCPQVSPFSSTSTNDLDEEAGTTIDGYDDLSVVKGRHTIKMGIGVERHRLNNSDESIAQGNISYASSRDFMNNALADYNFVGQLTLGGERRTVITSYAEDCRGPAFCQWRAGNVRLHGDGDSMVKRITRRWPLTSILAPALVLIAITVFVAFRSPEGRGEKAQIIANLRARIHHVFVIYQENRSFDFYFGDFPGADSLATAEARAHGFRQWDPVGHDWIKPFFITTPDVTSPKHSRGNLIAKSDRGRMDLFVAQEELYLMENGARWQYAHQMGLLTMVYEDCHTVPFLWYYARHFALYDHIFEGFYDGSTPGNIDLIAAQVGQTQWARDPKQASKPDEVGPGEPIFNDLDPHWGPYGGGHAPQQVQLDQDYATVLLTLLGRHAVEARNDDEGVKQDIGELARLDRRAIPWGWYQQGFGNGKGNDRPMYVPHHTAPQYFGYIRLNPEVWSGVHDLSDFSRPSPLILISPYAKSGAIVSDPGDHASFAKFLDALFRLPPLASLPDEKPHMPEGPRDMNPRLTDLLGGFDPARLAGSKPPIPASEAEIPDGIVNHFPARMSCAATGVESVFAPGAASSPPAGFNPLPRK